MKRYLMTFLTAIMTLCCAGAVFPLPSSGNSHDIASLHAWGPYSKRYAGISHIPDMRKGIRFDFSVMPGYYRNRQLVPHVLFESSYYPWEINPEMTRITYRYELEWKDRYVGRDTLRQQYEYASKSGIESDGIYRLS